MIETINQRDAVIKSITESKEGKIEELEDKLLKLRSLSIRTVELIVLWRDQFRYFALMTSKQRLARKKRVQQAIQTPFLYAPKESDYCENYLLKMKHDTKHFADLPLIKSNFNVGTQIDPFLT